MPTSNHAPEPGVVFDREKFLAAIHHIIHECNDRPDILGKTKLHKVLYYSDMLQFFVTGRPMTGVEYIKAPFGPTARYLDWALSELRSQNAISFVREEYFGLGKYRYSSRTPANSNLLSAQERALLNEVMSFVCERSAREISEFSHSQPWQDAEMWGRIPYAWAYQLVPETSPTDADRAWARDQEAFIKAYKRA